MQELVSNSMSSWAAGNSSKVSPTGQPGQGGGDELMEELLDSLFTDTYGANARSATQMSSHRESSHGGSNDKIFSPVSSATQFGVSPEGSSCMSSGGGYHQSLRSQGHWTASEEPSARSSSSASSAPSTPGDSHLSTRDLLQMGELLEDV